MLRLGIAHRDLRFFFQLECRRERSPSSYLQTSPENSPEQSSATFTARSILLLALTSAPDSPPQYQMPLHQNARPPEPINFFSET